MASSHAAAAAGSTLQRVEHWMPGVRVLRTYERSWLSRDLIAGIVLVTLLVPQGMAYAELAGLPAITGLYTTVMCLLAYAIVGPSPILVLGPDSSLGPMIAATILPLAAGSQEQAIAIVLVTLLVPQGMAYAELAGLPAITGLYTTVMCLLAYAIVGPSPILVLGPDSSLGPMIAATILPLAAGSQEQAVALAGMLALIVGVITVGAGVARLGFVADLLSSPVRTGYLAGLAVVILIGQLPKLFGFSTDADGLVAEAVAFIQGLDMTNAWALGIGLLSLGIILGLRHFAPRTPGILVAVVAAIALSMLFGLAEQGVSVIGVLPQGFPLPDFPAVDRPTSHCCSPRRWASRWCPSGTPSPPRAASPAAPGTRSTATRSWPASARPTWPRASSAASQSAPAARARRWPSSLAPRRR